MTQVGDPRPDWRLPRGVSRSLWNYTQHPEIARQYDASLRNSGLAQYDGAFLAPRWTNPGRLVDLGCGTGRLAVAAAQHGWQVVGVDLSLEMLKQLQQKAAETTTRIAPLAANLCELGCLADATFDAALLMYATLGMIPQAEDRQRLLQEVSRLLKPGGWLALHVHNLWFNLWDPQGRRWLWSDRWRALWTGRGGDRIAHDRGIPNSFMHVFRWPELRRMIQAAGLKVETCQPLNSTASGPLPQRWWLPQLRANGWLVIASRP